MPRLRPSQRTWTLLRVVLISLAVVGFLILGAFTATWLAWKRSILASAERARNQTAATLALRVRDSLDHAPQAIATALDLSHHGGITHHDPAGWERLLFTLLHAHPNLSEVSFTHAQMIGEDDEGYAQLAPQNRWQLRLFRSPEGIASYWLRSEKKGNWINTLRKGEVFFKGKHLPQETLSIKDPTEHGTFTTPARKDLRRELLWSDLHWHPADGDLPESNRRLEISVQQAVLSTDGTFIGVIRSSLLLDAVEKVLEIASDEFKGHLLFLCDFDGRVVSRFEPDQKHQVEEDDELRIHSQHLPTPVRIATQLLKEKPITAEEGSRGFRFIVDDIPYWASFQMIEKDRERAIGVIVPESHYVGHLVEVRNQLFAGILLTLACSTVLALILLRFLRRVEQRILRETGKLKRLDFTPSRVDIPFQDVAEILEGLEKAKTTVRSMGRYLPLDVVRQLFAHNQEPTLHAEARELTILFTDISQFTSIAEALPPDRLTQALGLYLETMTQVIQQQYGGTIDKFIGDGIMAFWNAPEHDPLHSQHACEASLACIEALNKLFESKPWQGLPPFHTRFGIHRDRVMVGNFGAPERMNYTAMGDGVNVASRLEGLNKTLGTQILVSQAVREIVGELFEFKVRETMSIKGRTEPLQVFELTGKAGNRAAGI